MTLKEVRELSGLNQTEISDKLGMTRQGYAKMEKSGIISKSMLIALSRIIGDNLTSKIGV